MIGSPEVNKAIRHHLSPVLRQHGFGKVQTRLNWGWHGPCTWVLVIRAVGGYFAGVTGWPSMSIGVQLGVWYDFIPLDFSGAIRLSPDGKPLPRDHECQQRSHLDIGLDQRQHTRQLKSLAEQVRTDLWWVEPDGNNIGVVVQDIKEQFLVAGLPWFERMIDILEVYSEVKNEHDCFNKFSRAAYLAKYLELDEEHQAFRSKMEHEAHRIGKTDWLALYP